MNAGRPKADPTKPSRRPRPSSQISDLIQPVPAPDPPPTPKRTRSNKQARQKPKQSFVGLLLADDRLNDDDREGIRHAHEVGFTSGDVSALVVYEIRLARKFYEQGSLASKDLIVALNKCASQAAAAAQLTATNQAGNLPSRVEIVFTPDGATPGDKDPLGDRLDVE